MKVSLAMVLGLALVLGAPVARADGVFLSPSKMDAGLRGKLRVEVSRGKATHPEVFSKIRALRGHRPEVYRNFRSQEPTVLPELVALGPDAGWALVDAIAFDGIERGAASREEWDAVREGLLLALAELEMPEAGPVFRQVFASSQGDWVALRAAAIGLGRLGGDPERAVLFRALDKGGVQRDAALWGLRYVRVPAAVDAVAPLLHDTSPETVELAARTLGYQGSSWAWRTGKAGAAIHQMPIRTKCRDALLSAYLRYDDSVREHLARALSMVDLPDTLGKIDELLGSVTDDEDRKALIGLKKRLSLR